MLITKAIGRYLMNGYSIINERPVKKETGEGYPWSLTYFLTKRYVF